MKTLVIGSGGREHALAWRLARSPRVTSVALCPGNGGTASLGPSWTIDPIADPEALCERVRSEGIDRVVIGPEAPLVAGLADRLRAQGVPTFGVGASAARLEGSKAFTKEFLARHDIPTAPFRVVRDADELSGALESFPNGVVVKADGLAAGKGVIVTDDRSEAEAAARAMLDGSSFGDAGRVVVLEEKLRGVEVSMLAFVAGRQHRWLEPAQDYKPRFEGNEGPNTGGMGAFSPADTVADLREEIDRTILHPTLAGLADEGIPYHGLLYIGLMLTDDGPQVLEFNCRFGDPETQPLLARLETDLIDIFEAIDEERLDSLELSWDPRAALCLVLASEGYPGSYPKGKVITGETTSPLDDDVQVFHAGTGLRGEELLTTGGRVFGVTALGKDLAEARARAYARADKISFEGCVRREDIASDALARG